MNAWQFVTRSFVTSARLDAGCDHFYESPSVGPSKKKLCPGNKDGSADSAAKENDMH